MSKCQAPSLKCTVQIEGQAEILGGFAEKKMQGHLAFMRRQYPEAIARWEKRPNMVICRIRPTFAVIGASAVGELECLDLEKEKAYAQQWATY